jgi:hypothetical protein
VQNYWYLSFQPPPYDLLLKDGDTQMRTRSFITLALLASCTILLSFIPDADAGQTADACVNETTGAIRLLLSGGCNSGENVIS